jgi:hypothetical protein
LGTFFEESLFKSFHFAIKLGFFWGFLGFFFFETGSHQVEQAGLD